MPFNYLGEFTDNRSVILIIQQGGKQVYTPKYEDRDYMEDFSMEKQLEKLERLYAVNRLEIKTVLSGLSNREARSSWRNWRGRFHSLPNRTKN